MFFPTTKYRVHSIKYLPLQIPPQPTKVESHTIRTKPVNKKIHKKHFVII